MIVESEIGAAHLQSSHPKERPRTYGGLSTYTTIEPTAEPFDHPISPSVALPQGQVVQTIRGGDEGAAATVGPLSVTTATPLFLEQP